MTGGGGGINIHFIIIQNLLIFMNMNVKQTAAGLPPVGYSIILHSSVYQDKDYTSQLFHQSIIQKCLANQRSDGGH